MMHNDVVILVIELFVCKYMNDYYVEQAYISTFSDNHNVSSTLY
jgi:hypothetical protein